MRRLLMASLCTVLLMGQASAQDLNIRDVFKQMPDSLMPYLSITNRLDFIDFIDSDMKAQVKNQMDEDSEMTTLGQDSLSIRMSEALRVDMFLVTLSEPVDSSSAAVAIIETFQVDSLYGESSVRYYTLSWQPLMKEPPLDAASKKRIHEHILQNILKKDDEILNKG